ncbi:MAG TPA: RidA family protein [Chloroflexota bacterium]|nr:RidA family protein [Chloroflexota bacterium]
MVREAIPTEGGRERAAGMVAGVKAGGFIFFSAIRGTAPGTRQMSDDTKEQARQAFENLKGLLAASGATLDHVVKVTLYLHDLKYRTPFHEVWMEYFPTNPPARIAVRVADANTQPGGNAHFALDVIALAP